MGKKHKKRTVLQQIEAQSPSPTDPDGSWTGKPKQKDEIPVQDVDDL